MAGKYRKVTKGETVDVRGVTLFRCIAMAAMISEIGCMNNQARDADACTVCLNADDGLHPTMSKGECISGCGAKVRNNSRCCTPCQKINRMFDKGSPEWVAAVLEVKRMREDGTILSRRRTRWQTGE